MNTIEIKLDAMVYGGDAMGRLADGRAVFVPYALPGERVCARMVEEKRGHARAELIEILVPSPERITPRCRHFGVCGGCHYQQIAYERQLEYKNNILREQFMRIAGIQAPPMSEMEPSPMTWNYRNTVQFHLDPAGKLGFQKANSHEVVAIQECHIPENCLNETWPCIELEPLPGLERLELRAGFNEDMMLVLESSDPHPPELSVDLPISVIYSGAGEAIVLAGDDAVWMEVGGRLFRCSARSFFQVNTGQAGKMVEYLLSILPLTPQATVVDVYCGVGLFSAFLAPEVGRCVGIELSPSACLDFSINLDEFDHVELYEGDAGEILPAMDIKPDYVVVDPPRSGLEGRVIDALVRMKPKLLAYVSCDPSTLGRDTRRLSAAGYHLVKVKPFDLFPQTYHIESISLFEQQV